MDKNLQQWMSDSMEIIALMDILCFILTSEHDEQIDNLNIATLARIILDKLQKLKNNIDYELIKNAAS